MVYIRINGRGWRRKRVKEREREEGVIYEYRSLGKVNFKNKKVEEKIDLLQFLDKHFVEGMDKKVFLLLKDVDNELSNPKVIALVKKMSETAVYNMGYNMTIIIVSQNVQVPKELENYISIVEIPKLNTYEIEDYIREVA